MTKLELLELVRDGAYGADIPLDDETSAILSECVEAGLIRSAASRIDDFFWLTAKGTRVRHNDSSITSRL